MKKGLAVFVCMLLVMSLAACTQQKEGKTSSAASSAVTGTSAVAESGVAESSDTPSEGLSSEASSAGSSQEAAKSPSSSKKAAATTGKVSSKKANVSSNQEKVISKPLSVPSSNPVENKETPSQTVVKVFRAFNQYDGKTVEYYLAENWDTSGDIGAEDDVLTGYLQEAFDLMYAHASCQVVSEQVSGDKATVTVKITNTDFQSVLDAYGKDLEELLGSISEDNPMSNEQIQEETTKCLIARLRTAGQGTWTSTLDLVKQDGVWKIAHMSQLLSAMLGNVEVQ